MTKLVKVADWTDGTRVNVVFVHGLGGNAYDTWRRGAEDNTFWPVWLACDIPGLAAWTLTYDAALTNWCGTAMPVQDRAKNVLECFLGQRELNRLPLVFVCHSLGGLVVKQVLRAADGRRAYGTAEAAFLDSVSGVVFLATPHSGSLHATLLDKLRLIVWPSVSTLDLVRNNANLRDLNVWYRNWSGDIRQKVFYEKQSTTAGRIVADDSSDPGLLHVDPVGIDADHLLISKPADSGELVYARTRDFITDEILRSVNPNTACGVFRALDLPTLPRPRSYRFVPIVARLAVLLIIGLIVFKGVEGLFFAPDVLGAATIEQIETAVRAKSQKLTSTQIDQFIRSLRELNGDPSFERAVEEAKKGNTRVAEGIWLQIYENRKKDAQRAQKEQAEAARNLAASAVTNNVAQGLKWYREATSPDPDNMAGWLGLGDAAMAAGTLQEADRGYLRYLELARMAGNEREIGVGLDRRGGLQVSQGNLAAAATSYQSSLAIADRFAKSDPGNAGWQGDLSVSYSKVGDVQLAQGNLAAALTSYQASLAIREALAKSDPGNAGWQRELSLSYSEVGYVLVLQGNLAAALTSYHASLAIREGLAKSDPGNTGWQRDLAVLNGEVGDVQLAQGNLAAALTSYMASLAIADRLAKSDPGNTSWQRDLALSNERIGDVRLAQGNLAAALTSYQASLAIREVLAKSDPGNAGWQRDLSVLNERIGDVQMAQNNLPVALTSFQASLAIADRLAKSDPGNAGWQRDLSVSNEKIGDVQVAQGNLAAALISYQAGLAITDRLAKSDPGNAALQRDQSVSFNKVGDVQVAQGDLAAALTSYQASLAIREGLAKSDPGNAGWQRDLSVSNERIGNVQLAQGNLAAALTSYQASLDIAERLAKFDLGNAGWQRDLAASNEKVGDVQVAQGNLVAALTSYLASLAIVDRLAKSEPGNTGWQHDLSDVYSSVADAYEKTGQPSKALEALAAGRAIMKRLVEQFPEGFQWKQELSRFDQRIAKLRG